MKIGLISDVHGNIFGLEAALSRLDTFGAEEFICAGDIVGYYPYVNEVIERLRERSVHCVMGNHDALLCGHIEADEKTFASYMLPLAEQVISPANRRWLCALPLSLNLNIADIHLEVYHGSPRAPLSEYIYPDSLEFNQFENRHADYIVLGHTHWPLVQNLPGTTVINPGSCGQARNRKRGASFALLDTESRRITLGRAVYNLKPLINAIEKDQYPRLLIDIFLETE